MNYQTDLVVCRAVGVHNVYAVSVINLMGQVRDDLLSWTSSVTASADLDSAEVSRRKMDGVGCSRFGALAPCSIFTCDTSLA